jgi:hypothetical protein
VGYTHYWTINGIGDQRAWSNAIMAAMAILERSPVPLADGAGEGDWCELTDGRIALNGRERDRCDSPVYRGLCNYCGQDRYPPDPRSQYGRHDLAHETFLIRTVLTDYASDPRDFCKTAQKPYDAIVTAILATLEHYAPTIIRVSSDGTPLDWVRGVRLARELTGDHTIGIPRAVCELSQYTSEYQAQLASDIAEAERLIAA